VHFVTIVRIENGHMSPTVDLLDKLARGLDIPVRAFFPPTTRRSGRRRAT
jgi:transcriptional regulator with XRE-family HTH domain